MCQLNIYMVPKDVPSDEVIAALNRAFESDVATDATQTGGFKLPKAYSSEYRAYCCAALNCNCGSIIGSLEYQDGDRTKTITEVLLEQQQQKLQELENIREFMERPTYASEREEFDRKNKELYEKLNKFSDPLLVEERRRIEELEKENLTPQKFNQRLQEIYREMAQLEQQMEEDPEYLKVEKEFEEFLNENELMDRSTGFRVTEKDPVEVLRVRSIESLLADDNEPDLDEFFSKCSDEEESPLITDNIYEEIQNCKREIERIKAKPPSLEFDRIKNFANAILKLTDNIKIAACWQDEGELPLEEGKTVNIQDFKAEDVAYLQYLQVLTVVR